MTELGTTGPRKGGRPAWLAGLWAAALTGLVGCSGFDEFSWRKMNFEVFRDPPEPLAVIRSSKDGNERARALRCLKEPSANGGSQEDQDAVVAVLNYSAAHETQPWCRLAAISTLGRFRDPRAAEGLKEAYYRAGSFPPATATIIRRQAITALGETKNPAAVDLLVRVLREPPVEGPDQDRQHKLDERIAAARALGNFQQYQGTAALVEALRSAEKLKTEDDVPLRNAAHESLVNATGRNLPPESQAWAELLHNPDSASRTATAQNGFGDRFLQLTGLR